MLSQFVSDKSNLKIILEDTTKDIKANRLLMGWNPNFIVNPKMKQIKTTMKDVINIMQSVERVMG